MGTSWAARAPARLCRAARFDSSDVTCRLHGSAKPSGRLAQPKRPSPRLSAPRARCFAWCARRSRAVLLVAAEEVDVEAELREIVAYRAEAGEVIARADGVDALVGDPFARRHADVVHQEHLRLELAGHGERRLIIGAECGREVRGHYLLTLIDQAGPQNDMRATPALPHERHTRLERPCRD